MKLEKLSYSEFKNEPNEWTFEECTFGSINLIVGKNATGKTRTLNVIRGLAAQLSDSRPLQMSEGDFVVNFASDGRSYDYNCIYHNRRVVLEELKINDEIYVSCQDL